MQRHLINVAVATIPSMLFVNKLATGINITLDLSLRMRRQCLVLHFFQIMNCMDECMFVKINIDRSAIYLMRMWLELQLNYYIFFFRLFHIFQTNEFS